jgi:epoxide hydrolase-like predicted phosphatase
MEKNAPAIRAVIFDMGGVILRTEDLTSRTNLAKKFGLTRKELEAIVFQSPESVQAELGEFSAAQHWKNMARRLNFPESELDEFQRAYWDGDAVDTQLEQYIRGLRPRYKTGLLSNAWHGAREKATDLYTFLTAFDVVIFSADVHLRKPDPRIFHLMIARLGVKAQEAVFVDDFMNNIEGAQAVGLKTVLFKGREDAVRQLKEMGVG